jgi:hypothetical protein
LVYVHHLGLLHSYFVRHTLPIKELYRGL